MVTNEDRILNAVSQPRTGIEIEKVTKLPRKEITRAIRKLEKQGLVISRGMTAARRHMTLSAAINLLFDELARLSREMKKV